ncbi:hypothetical protein GCM10023219_29280 [Stakelama sediminis]|uniref:Type IV secretory pathway VirB2 component (Pilin) n=1 Tax=Stakelama sediminis TaxID=463200 RepID=A0A840Z390_9SPHN|nr:TrbC/VirB2 family protein [Stakelama sediminis]MBB5720224.1 type IV secretory pathway VirB2 component (pilin) [Stakelama sediminis]
MIVLLSGAYLSDPSRPSPLLAAMAWVEGTVLGTVATTVAILCVAMVGLLMLGGRLDIRRGLTVVLGCFVLFGASTIVSGFRGAIGSVQRTSIPSSHVTSELPAPIPSASPPAYDPYAGASVIHR